MNHPKYDPVLRKMMKTYVSTMDDPSNALLYVGIFCKSGRHRSEAMMKMLSVWLEHRGIAHATESLAKHGFWEKDVL